jgi:hypothetical protein
MHAPGDRPNESTPMAWQRQHALRHRARSEHRASAGYGHQSNGLRDLRSGLHIYDGIIPSMQHGDVLGHGTMGEVVEVGAENKKLEVGDRVVVL